VSERLRWGVLSTARIGTWKVIPAIHDSCNGEVVAIASRDLERARACASQNDIPRAYGSYEELLADADVDAIYNPLPVGMHAEWSIRCAEAGKPTLCEKPLAADAGQARRMVDVFERADVPLAEALMYRFNPVTQRVKEMLNDGAVGQIRLVRASFTAHSDDMDNIRFKKELAGGAMLDLGCYCVSIMRLLIGQEPDAVEGLAHFGERSGVDEWVVGMLCFPGGALGSFVCGFRTPFECSYEVWGSTGRIRVPGGVVPGPEARIQHWFGDGQRDVAVPWADHYKLMVEDFADALLAGRPPRFRPEDSVRNMEVIDRVLASAAGGRAS